MWFDTWASLIRIVVLGTLGYIALIVILRVSGKRTLSKMNAFDFVITISLGSVYASLLVSDSLALIDGIVALAVLVGLQWCVSAIYVRSRWFERLVKDRPQLLYWQGEYLDEVLKRERVTRDEVQAAMRDSNVTQHESALAVLETDGSVTVIAAEEEQMPHALEGVKRD